MSWQIEHRQVPYGDFGGGISDDTDLLNLWPGLALMGAQPDKIRRSTSALLEAGKAPEALREFEAVLKKEPNRLTALSAVNSVTATVGCAKGVTFVCAAPLRLAMTAARISTASRPSRKTGSRAGHPGADEFPPHWQSHLVSEPARKARWTRGANC